MTDLSSMSGNKTPPVKAGTQPVKASGNKPLRKVNVHGRTVAANGKANGAHAVPRIRGSQDYNHDAYNFTRAVTFEKSIILPALVNIFNKAVQDGEFDIGKNKILDMGCGPFHLGRGLITAGFDVDGYDPAPNMIASARSLAAKGPNPLNRKPILTTDTRALTIPYRATMMNFVHQCSRNTGELTKLFNEAFTVTEGNGILLVTGAHPDYLHIPHAACEYSVRNPREMEDGKSYTGTIFDQMGDPMFNLKDDHFWRLDTLRKVAEECGFEMKRPVETIADVPGNILRPASKEPPYFVMTFRREANAPAHHI